MRESDLFTLRCLLFIDHEISRTNSFNSDRSRALYVGEKDIERKSRARLSGAPAGSTGSNQLLGTIKVLLGFRFNSFGRVLGSFAAGCAALGPLFRHAQPAHDTKGPLGEKGFFASTSWGDRQTARRCAVSRRRKAGGGVWRYALGGEVPLLLEWRPRWTKQRRLGRQPDAVQIAPNRCGIG